MPRRALSCNGTLLPAVTYDSKGFDVAGSRKKAAESKDVLITGMLAAAAQRGGLGVQQQETLGKLCHFYARLVHPAPDVAVSDLPLRGFCCELAALWGSVLAAASRGTNLPCPAGY